MTTQYAARTTYQTLTFKGYDFLITRIDWSSDQFPQEQYTYKVYEPLISFMSNADGCHSTMYNALGQWWGEVDSYFPGVVFDHLPYATHERSIQVKSYQAFRKAIADLLIEQAVYFKDRWLPLPLI